MKCDFTLYKKGVALCLSVIFLISGQTYPAHAQNLPKTLTANISILDSQNLGVVSIPAEWGEVSDFHAGIGQPVILIQDAHAIPDAQKNIHALIRFFEKKYGVQNVAVEGAASPLDAQIFRSFPDQKILKKIFKEYYARAELSGAAAASVFTKSSVRFEGVEDWDLYESAISHYLQAEVDSKELLEQLNAERLTLNAQKKKIYSKDLLAVDQSWENFKDNHSNFLETFKTLKTIQTPLPDSQLAAIAKTADVDLATDDQLNLEMNKAIAMISASLRKNEKLNRVLIMEMNQKQQSYQIGELSQQEFAAWIQKTADMQKLKISFSNELLDLAQLQFRVETIRGTKLLKEFEDYVKSIKSTLVKQQPEDARPQIFALEQDSEEIRLLRGLVNLELSRDDWNELKLQREFQSAKVSSDNLPGDNAFKSFSTQIAFYENAEKREEAFFKNLKQILKGTSYNVSGTSNEMRSTLYPVRVAENRPAIFVAGGFHTEGMTEKLKKAGMSYLVITPKITSLPAKNMYREHMAGNVSWKSYFKVENGRVRPYDAFVRATRDQLLRVDSTTYNVQRSENTKDGVLGTNYAVLKLWRDQIIRDLADQGRTQDAWKYTKFLDEILSDVRSTNYAVQREGVAERLSRRVDQFVGGLRSLHADGKLNQKNVVGLLRSMTAVEWATGTAMMEPGARFSMPSVNSLAVEVDSGNSLEAAREAYSEWISEMAQHKDDAQYRDFQTLALRISFFASDKMRKLNRMAMYDFWSVLREEGNTKWDDALSNPELLIKLITQKMGVVRSAFAGIKSAPSPKEARTYSDEKSAYVMRQAAQAMALMSVIEVILKKESDGIKDAYGDWLRGLDLREISGDNLTDADVYRQGDYASFDAFLGEELSKNNGVGMRDEVLAELKTYGSPTPESWVFADEKTRAFSEELSQMGLWDLFATARDNYVFEFDDAETALEKFTAPSRKASDHRILRLNHHFQVLRQDRNRLILREVLYRWGSSDRPRSHTMFQRSENRSEMRIAKGELAGMRVLVDGESVIYQPASNRMDWSLVRPYDNAATVQFKIDNEIARFENIAGLVFLPQAEASGFQKEAIAIQNRIKLWLRQSQGKHRVEYLLSKIHDQIINKTIFSKIPQSRRNDLAALVGELIYRVKNSEAYFYLGETDEESQKKIKTELFDLEKKRLMVRVFKLLLEMPYGFKTEDKDTQLMQRELLDQRKTFFISLYQEIEKSLKVNTSAEKIIGDLIASKTQKRIDLFNKQIVADEEKLNALKLSNPASDEVRALETSLLMKKQMRDKSIELRSYLESLKDSLDHYDFVFDETDVDSDRQIKMDAEEKLHSQIMTELSDYSFDEGLREAFDATIRDEIKKGRTLGYAAAKYLYSLYSFDPNNGQELLSDNDFLGFMMRYYYEAVYGVKSRTQQLQDKPIVVFTDTPIANETQYQNLLNSMEGHGRIVAIVVTKSKNQDDSNLRYPHWFSFAKQEGIVPILNLDFSGKLEDFVQGGEITWVDGLTGEVYHQPDSQTTDELTHRRDSYFYLNHYFNSKAKQPAQVAGRDFPFLYDTAQIDYFLNAEDSESSIADEKGGSGVGLFRMEKLMGEAGRDALEGDEDRLKNALLEFVTSPYFSDRPGSPFIIRLFDVQDDKRPRFLLEGRTPEEVDAIVEGYANIRFYLGDVNDPTFREFRSFGKRQIRAIMMAALRQPHPEMVKILFPNVLTTEEVLLLEGLIQDAEKELIENREKAGDTLTEEELKIIRSIPVGYMVEDTRLASKVDAFASSIKILEKTSGRKRFLAVGTNDLLKSVLRDYPETGERDQMHPKMINDLYRIILAANRNELEITIEGEWASKPQMLFVAVHAMIDNNSRFRLVPFPEQVPYLKALLRELQLADFSIPVKYDGTGKKKSLNRALQEAKEGSISSADLQDIILGLVKILEKRITDSEDFKQFVKTEKASKPSRSEMRDLARYAFEYLAPKVLKSLAIASVIGIATAAEPDSDVHTYRLSTGELRTDDKSPRMAAENELIVVEKGNFLTSVVQGNQCCVVMAHSNQKSLPVALAHVYPRNDQDEYLSDAEVSKYVDNFVNILKEYGITQGNGVAYIYANGISYVSLPEKIHDELLRRGFKVNQFKVFSGNEFSGMHFDGEIDGSKVYFEAGKGDGMLPGDPVFEALEIHPDGQFAKVEPRDDGLFYVGVGIAFLALTLLVSWIPHLLYRVAKSVLFDKKSFFQSLKEHVRSDFDFKTAPTADSDSTEALTVEGVGPALIFSDDEWLGATDVLQRAGMLEIYFKEYFNGRPRLSPSYSFTAKEYQNSAEPFLETLEGLVQVKENPQAVIDAFRKMDEELNQQPIEMLYWLAQKLEETPRYRNPSWSIPAVRSAFMEDLFGLFHDLLIWMEPSREGKKESEDLRGSLVLVIETLGQKRLSVSIYPVAWENLPGIQDAGAMELIEKLQNKAGESLDIDQSSTPALEKYFKEMETVNADLSSYLADSADQLKSPEIYRIAYSVLLAMFFLNNEARLEPERIIPAFENLTGKLYDELSAIAEAEKMTDSAVDLELQKFGGNLSSARAAINLLEDLHPTPETVSRFVLSLMVKETDLVRNGRNIFRSEIRAAEFLDEDVLMVMRDEVAKGRSFNQIIWKLEIPVKKTGVKLRVRKTLLGLGAFEIEMKQPNNDWVKLSMSRLNLKETGGEIVLEDIAIDNEFKFVGQGMGSTLFAYLYAYAQMTQKSIRIPSTENYWLGFSIYKHWGEGATYEADDRSRQPLSRVYDNPPAEVFIEIHAPVRERPAFKYQNGAYVREWEAWMESGDTLSPKLELIWQPKSNRLAVENPIPDARFKEMQYSIYWPKSVVNIIIPAPTLAATGDRSESRMVVSGPLSSEIEFDEALFKSMGFKRSFWGRPADQRRLFKILTRGQNFGKFFGKWTDPDMKGWTERFGTAGPSGLQRSVVLQLEQPVTIDGVEYNAVMAKGLLVAPGKDQSVPLMPPQLAGQPAYFFEMKDGVVTRGKTEDRAAGAISVEASDAEADATGLVRFPAARVLGKGFFTNKSFKDSRGENNQLGVSLFLVRAEKFKSFAWGNTEKLAERRLRDTFDQLIWKLVEKYMASVVTSFDEMEISNSEIGGILSKLSDFGALLKQVHAEGVHEFFNLANVADWDGKLVVRDLPDFQFWSQIPEEDRLGYLINDVAMAMESLSLNFVRQPSSTLPGAGNRYELGKTRMAYSDLMRRFGKNYVLSFMSAYLSVEPALIEEQLQLTSSDPYSRLGTDAFAFAAAQLRGLLERKEKNALTDSDQALIQLLNSNITDLRQPTVDVLQFDRGNKESDADVAAGILPLDQGKGQAQVFSKNNVLSAIAIVFVPGAGVVALVASAVYLMRRLKSGKPASVELPNNSPQPKTPPESKASRSEVRGAVAEEEIKKAIDAAGGLIPYVQFQEMALYGKGGYYSAGAVQFNRDGGTDDEGVGFHTNAHMPKVTRALADHFLNVWKAMGEPDHFDIVELSGGDGSMAHNILEPIMMAADRYPDKFWNSLHYKIVELNEALITRQQSSLKKLKSVLKDRLQFVKASALNTGFDPNSVSGVVFSNELPDAFAVHRVVVRDGKLKEIYVGYNEQGFYEKEGDLYPSAKNDIEAYFEMVGSLPPEGKEFAVNLAMNQLMAEASRILKQGAVLTMDYGFSPTQHRYDSELKSSVWTFGDFDGAQPLKLGVDTTHNIDFETLQKMGQVHGLAESEVAFLPHFLGRVGFVGGTANPQEYVLAQTRNLSNGSSVFKSKRSEMRFDAGDKNYVEWKNELKKSYEAELEQVSGSTEEQSKKLVEIGNRYNLKVLNEFRRLFPEAPPVELVAVGSYGRGQMAPKSDFDVKRLVANQADFDTLEPIAHFFTNTTSDVFGLMWHWYFVDQGFSGAQADPRTLNELLDARPLEENQPLFKKTTADVHIYLQSQPVQALEGIIGLWSKDRKINGGYQGLYARQPNIKSGAGGLRDFYFARQAMLIMHGTIDEAVQKAELVKNDEWDKAVAAHDFLLNVRTALNTLQTQKGLETSDILEFQHQSDVARDLKYSSEPGKPSAIEQFLSDYRAANKTLFIFNNKVLRRALHKTGSVHTYNKIEFPVYLNGERLEGVELVERSGRTVRLDEGLTVLDKDLSLTIYPDAKLNARQLMKIFQFAAEKGYHINGELMDAIEAIRPQFKKILDEDTDFSKSVRDSMTNLLASSKPIGYLLFRMQVLEILSDVLPEYVGLQNRLIHSIKNALTLDAVAISSMDTLDFLLFNPEKTQDAFDFDAIKEQRLLRPLRAALLAQSMAGANPWLADELVKRLGLPESEESLALWLVKNRDALVVFNSRRGAEFVEDFIQFRIKTLENDYDKWLLLRAMTHVRAQLFQPARLQIYRYRARFEEVYDRESFMADQVLRERVEALRQKLSEKSESAKLIDGVHVKIKEVSGGLVRVDLALSADLDRPGTLRKVSALFASRGISILNQEIGNKSDGVLVDRFLISVPGEKGDARDQKLKALATDLTSDLNSLFNKNLAVESLFEKSPNNLFRRNKALFTLPTTVDVENMGDASFLNLETPDRLGIIYLAATVFEMHGVNIGPRSVVDTEGYDPQVGLLAKDVFHLQKMDEVNGSMRALNEAEVKSLTIDLLDLFEREDITHKTFSMLPSRRDEASSSVQLQMLGAQAYNLRIAGAHEKGAQALNVAIPVELWDKTFFGLANLLGVNEKSPQSRVAALADLGKIPADEVKAFKEAAEFFEKYLFGANGVSGILHAESRGGEFEGVVGPERIDVVAKVWERDHPEAEWFQPAMQLLLTEADQQRVQDNPDLRDFIKSKLLRMYFLSLYHRHLQVSLKAVVGIADLALKSKADLNTQKTHPLNQLLGVQSVHTPGYDPIYRVILNEGQSISDARTGMSVLSELANWIESFPDSKRFGASQALVFSYEVSEALRKVFAEMDERDKSEVHGLLENIMKINIPVSNLLRLAEETGLIQALFPDFQPLEHFYDAYRAGPVKLHHYSVLAHTLFIFEALEMASTSREGLFKRFQEAYRNIRLNPADLAALRLGLLLHDSGKKFPPDMFGLSHQMRAAMYVIPEVVKNYNLHPTVIDEMLFIAWYHQHLNEMSRSVTSRSPAVTHEQAVLHWIDHPSLKRPSKAESILFLNTFLVISFGDYLGLRPDNLTDPKAHVVLREVDAIYRDVAEYFNASSEAQTEIRNKWVTAVKKSDAVFLKAAHVRIEKNLDQKFKEFTDLSEDEIRAALNDFLGLYPASYLRRVTDQFIDENWMIYLSLVQSQKLKQPRQLKFLFEVYRRADMDFREVIVGMSQDKPGFLSHITTAMAVHGLNLHEAEVFTSDQFGVVMDRMRLMVPPDRSVNWSTVEEAISKDVEALVEGTVTHRELYQRYGILDFPISKEGRPGLTIRTDVSFEPIIAGQDHSVLSIQTPDRVGLLHIITRILAQGFEINILSANVQTHITGILDSFKVVDANGKPLSAKTQLSLQSILIPILSKPVITIEDIESAIERAKKMRSELRDKTTPDMSFPEAGELASAFNALKQGAVLSSEQQEILLQLAASESRAWLVEKIKKFIGAPKLAEIAELARERGMTESELLLSPEFCKGQCGESVYDLRDRLYSLFDSSVEIGAFQASDIFEQKYAHGFLIVRFPGVENQSQKMYLLDLTFSQFAIKQDGQSQSVDESLMRLAPHFREVLLRKGYVELEPKELTAYGNAFRAAGQTPLFAEAIFSTETIMTKKRDFFSKPMHHVAPDSVPEFARLQRDYLEQINFSVESAWRVERFTSSRSESRSPLPESAKQVAVSFSGETLDFESRGIAEMASGVIVDIETVGLEEYLAAIQALRDEMVVGLEGEQKKQMENLVRFFANALLQNSRSEIEIALDAPELEIVLQQAIQEFAFGDGVRFVLPKTMANLKIPATMVRRVNSLVSAVKKGAPVLLSIFSAGGEGASQKSESIVDLVSNEAGFSDFNEIQRQKADLLMRMLVAVLLSGKVKSRDQMNNLSGLLADAGYFKNIVQALSFKDGRLTVSLNILMRLAQEFAATREVAKAA